MASGSAPLTNVVSGKNLVSTVLASGNASIVPRSGALTLTTTNIGYRFQVVIDTLLSTQILSGNYTIKAVFQSTHMDINSSGTFFDDGTNKVIYSYYYYVPPLSGKLHIYFNMRCTAGSYTFNPSDYFQRAIYWEISSVTNTGLTGGGSSGSGDGKFYYYDVAFYDANGTNTVALASSLIEFVAGQSSYFPNPLITSKSDTVA